MYEKVFLIFLAAFMPAGALAETQKLAKPAGGCLSLNDEGSVMSELKGFATEFEGVMVEKKDIEPGRLCRLGGVELHFYLLNPKKTLKLKRLQCRGSDIRRPYLDSDVGSDDTPPLCYRIYPVPEGRCPTKGGVEVIFSLRDGEEREGKHQERRLFGSTYLCAPSASSSQVPDRGNRQPGK